MCSEGELGLIFRPDRLFIVASCGSAGKETRNHPIAALGDMSIPLPSILLHIFAQRNTIYMYMWYVLVGQLVPPWPSSRPDCLPCRAHRACNLCFTEHCTLLKCHIGLCSGRCSKQGMSSLDNWSQRYLSDIVRSCLHQNGWTAVTIHHEFLLIAVSQECLYIPGTIMIKHSSSCAK